VATTLSVVVSMMTQDGLAVGECERVEETELHFFTAARLALGHELEFRLELDGADGTVLGNMRVVAGVGPLRWRAKILNIHPDDRKLWDAWNTARRAGRIMSVSTTNLGAGLLGHAPTNADSLANERALARMEERRQRFAHLRSEWKEDEDDLFIEGAFDMTPV
jgi:hypothetical protein